MSFLEKWLKKLEEKKELRRMERSIIQLENTPLTPPLDHPKEKGEATGTFENVRAMVDRATEEKRKTRNTVQRILALLKDD